MYIYLLLLLIIIIDEKDLWSILGVTRNASQKEIKKQYHRVYI